MGFPKNAFIYWVFEEKIWSSGFWGEDSIRCVRILNKALILNCMVYATLCHIDSHLYQRRLCMLYSFVLTALTHHAWDYI
jgi:hypothetical protein